MKRKMDPARTGLENYQHRDQFGEWLGYRVLKVDRKRFGSETELKIREDHLSPAAHVHGGVISALFDFSCGAAVFSTMGPRDFASTVELKVNYFRPLNVGDVLRCKAQVVFRGKKLCTIHATLYRKGERNPVAMAMATFNVVSKT